MESFLWPLVIFHCIVGIIGLPGNALIILVYARKRQMMSPHVFILALAVADLVVCLFTPVTVYHWHIRVNYTSGFLCRLVLTVTFVTVYNSCFLTTAIAVDRYQAICRPHRRWMTVRRAKITAVLCLILAVLIGIPVFLSYDIVRGPTTNSVCALSTAIPSWVKYLKFTLIYVAPVSNLAISAILYGKIYLVVRRQTAVRPGQVVSSGQTTRAPIPSGVAAVSDTLGPSVSDVHDSFPQAASAQLKTRGPDGHTNSRANATAPVEPIIGLPRRDVHVAPKVRNKTTKMLVITTVVYFSTWVLGVSVLSIQNSTHQTDNVGSAFLYLFGFVFYVNNAVNPFIYGFTNRRFRQDCKQTLASLRSHFM